MRLPQSNYSGPYPVIMISGYRGLAETFIRRFSHFPLSVLVREESRLPELTKAHPQIFFHVGDVSDPSVGESWVEQTRTRFGRIDVLVNNAAVPGPPGALEHLNMIEYERTIAINLMAPIRLCQLVLKDLKESSFGVVVNLSGGGATQSRPGFSAYATSKCGLVRFTECLADEYPELSIYAISPGALRTPMMEKIAQMDPVLVPAEQRDAQKRVQEGAEDPNRAAELVEWLIEKRPKHLRGKLISAVWDRYGDCPEFSPKVGWWNLRRVDEICRNNLKSLS